MNHGRTLARTALILKTTALLAVSTSASAVAIQPNGQWYSFTHPIAGSPAGILSPDGPFTITSSTPVVVSITDFLQTGEWYTVFSGTDSNGPTLLVTPDVAFDAAPSNNNPEQTFLDTRFSHGQFVLPAGTSVFTVQQNDLLPGY